MKLLLDTNTLSSDIENNIIQTIDNFILPCSAEEGEVYHRNVVFTPLRQGVQIISRTSRLIEDYQGTKVRDWITLEDNFSY